VMQQYRVLRNERGLNCLCVYEKKISRTRAEPRLLSMAALRLPHLASPFLTVSLQHMHRQPNNNGRWPLRLTNFRHISCMTALHSTVLCCIITLLFVQPAYKHA
jgi:hypothetical protein